MGCGPFTVAENPKLTEEIARRRYIGFDAVSEAIDEARKRQPDKSFEVRDLVKNPAFQKEFLQIDTGIVLSRRFLQNLTPEERAGQAAALKSFRHGIVIESFKSPLAAVNASRARAGRSERATPAFNHYLEDSELETLFPRWARVTNFMGSYYFLTRVLDLEGWETPIHRAAAELALAQVEAEDWGTDRKWSVVRGITW